jgi:signal transduction histidine kinase
VNARSTDAQPQRRHWLTGIAVVVFVVIIEMIPQLVSTRTHTGTRLVYWLFETSLVVAALSVHHHWGMRRRIGTPRMMVVSLLISAAVGAACAMLFLLLTTLRLAAAPRGLSSLRSILAYGVVLGLVQCGVWALGFIYPFATEDARLRALETEKLKLETEKLKLEADKLKLEADTLRAAAELARLRSQLQPHFLLNTLNAIAGLVSAQPREARRLVACLGDLLRDSLRDASEMQTLDEEITWLQRYAEILEARHSGVLTFRWEIADAARSVLVPRLLLQPLVENAVNHGALHRAEGGEVIVRAEVSDGSIAVIVEDNGPGFAPDAPPRSGAFGLHSVRRRLELRYERANFAVVSTSEGTRCTVTVPRVVDSERLPLAEAS